METVNFKVNKSTTAAYNLYQANKVDFTTLSAEQAKELAKHQVIKFYKKLAQHIWNIT